MKDDHAKHFFVCFLIAALGTIPWWLLGCKWMLALPMIMGMGAGFYKELKDIPTTGFDWTDIVADALGVLCAHLLWGVSTMGG
jgi:hypothetical protein